MTHRRTPATETEPVPRYVLGVDGGTTKTIALVARSDGAVVGAGRAGGSNIYAAPLATAVERSLANIEAAVAIALNQAGVAAGGQEAAVFSLSGADWPEDFALLEAALTERGYGRRVTVVNDAVGGLWADAPDGPVVAVVCGTGAATAARAADGRLWHSSFWQVAGGGGAQALERTALRAIVRAELGLAPPTALTARALARFDLPSVEALLHQRTARASTALDQSDGLARVLLDTAAAGDSTACRLVRRHGRGLGDLAVAAARRVGIGGTFRVVLSGGVVRHPAPLLVAARAARVRRDAPDAWVVLGRREPVAGAVLLALRTAEAPVTAATLATLDRTLPPTALFAT